MFVVNDTERTELGDDGDGVDPRQRAHPW